MADRNTHLFSPLTLRGVTVRNRIGVSPMCQYSAQDGFANNWHLVHLGTRAVGGAGIVVAEATAITPEGRISPHDLGIWKDEHIPSLALIAAFIKAQGAVPGIQLAHAGRKGSCARPWEGGKPLSPAAWQTIGPSPISFSPEYPVPKEMTLADIDDVKSSFRAAARRAIQAGFEVVEIHSAHGYLLHEFLSTLSNLRRDAYGGSFENRTRLVRGVIQTVRAELPDRCPLFIRISATDWLDGGWDLDQSVQLAKDVKVLGVDLVDCSSGGLAPGAHIPLGPGYQVPFASRIRREAGVATAAVGLITEASQADEIIRSGAADVVFLARELLRNPYWPIAAGRELHQPLCVPPQYLRAY